MIAYVQRIFTIVLIILSVPALSHSHCDTLDGPVVATARAALEKGEVTPVLKWVPRENEKEIQDLFKKILAVKQGDGRRGTC